MPLRHHNPRLRLVLTPRATTPGYVAAAGRRNLLSCYISVSTSVCTPWGFPPNRSNESGAPRGAFKIRDDLYLSQIRYGDLYIFRVVFIPPWGFPSNRSGAFKGRVYLYLSQIDCGDLYSFIWCLYRRDKNKRHRDRN